MQIICIYGGTGIGKRTIGEALAKQTGFTLFHNHLTIDPALTLIPMRSPQFFPIVNRFRLALLRAAARTGVRGVIVTAGWATNEKNAWIEGLKRLNREKNISVRFVHLYCEEKEHLQRVIGESRKRFKKSRNAAEVKADLRKKDFRTPHARTAFSLDTTGLSAAVSARRIAAHYKLTAN